MILRFGRVLDLLFVGAASLPPAYVRAARSRPYDVQSNILGTLPCDFTVISFHLSLPLSEEKVQNTGKHFSL